MKKRKLKLNDKQKAFCDYFHIHRNGTRAYKDAGYKAKSASVASVGAARLLRNTRVKKRIVKLDRKAIRKIKLTKEMVVDGFHAIAMGADKLSDRSNALDRLSKMGGFYELDNEQKSNDITIETKF